MKAQVESYGLKSYEKAALYSLFCSYMLNLCFVEKNLVSTMLPVLKNWLKAEGESFGAGSFFSELFCLTLRFSALNCSHFTSISDSWSCGLCREVDWNALRQRGMSNLNLL